MTDLIVTTSWDDGSKFDLRVAELMGQYGIKGTFYIPKSYLNNSLLREEVIALDKKFEIGSHTLNHVDLTRVSLSEAKKEIKCSKDYLEDILGHSIYMFCYPKGRYNRDIKKIVRDAKFIAARTTNPGDFAPPGDPYEWQITLDASNGSPRLSFNIWRHSRIAVGSLFDWELRAKLLFDLALKNGGVYHLWGHPAGYEERHQWAKLECTLDYISKKEGVRYLTNGEIFRSVG